MVDKGHVISFGGKTDIFWWEMDYSYLFPRGIIFEGVGRSIKWIIKSLSQPLLQGIWEFIPLCLKLMYSSPQGPWDT